MDSILYIAGRTESFTKAIPKDERKKYGQFFTPSSTAIYMASLFNFDLSKKVIRILDAGAGAGILSIAVISRLKELEYEGLIELTCYETDEKIIPLLRKNLEEICLFHGNVSYKIIEDNYILSQMWPFPNAEYDYIIGNPPYQKIRKDAAEARYMHQVCYGAPNLYFLFWAMGIHNLKKDGELVYIVPRSWTSGAYFEKFRSYLFNNCSITDVHLFMSRDKVFDGESVLQETMIIKIIKSTVKPEKIRITSSTTSDFHKIDTVSVDYNIVVSPQNYVYLVTSEEEIKTLNEVNRQPETLISDNLPMKTGIIVDFRTWDLLRNNKEDDNTYPLFYSQNIKNGRVVWPIGGKKKEYICTQKDGLLQENANYLFIKRFTSKEEKRRLQCGVYLASDFPNYTHISTQNKINYIKCTSPEEAFGLYVILNSTLYDRYYRILNGSTQVNSTEINMMPMPAKNTIISMGREIQNYDLTEENCNKILRKWIK